MQKALTGYDSVYMTHSFPLAGRADGEKRKEPHDGKKSSHTDITETRADFCVHAALGRLRFVSGSTAQLLYLVISVYQERAFESRIAEQKVFVLA